MSKLEKEVVRPVPSAPAENELLKPQPPIQHETVPVAAVSVSGTGVSDQHRTIPLQVQSAPVCAPSAAIETVAIAVPDPAKKSRWWLWN